MELLRKIFQGGNQTRSGAVDGIADGDVAAIAHGMEKAPAWKIREGFGAMRRSAEMRLHKYQKIRLKADDFLEVDLRPALRGIDDGNGAAVAQRIGDEGVLANGDERFDPDDEEHTARRQVRQALLQGVQLAVEVGSNRATRFRRAEQVRETLGGGDNGVDSVRVGGVGGDTNGFEGLNGLEAVQTFCNQDKIRMQGGNGFDAGIDGAADFWFLPGFRREIAVVGVSHQAVLQAERINCFGKIWREGNDAADGLRNADSAADFVGNLAICGGSIR